jgi:hypothetical protein
MKSSVYGVFFKDIEKIWIKNVHLIIKMFNVLDRGMFLCPCMCTRRTHYSENQDKDGRGNKGKYFLPIKRAFELSVLILFSIKQHNPEPTLQECFLVNTIFCRSFGGNILGLAILNVHVCVSSTVIIVL